MFLVCLSMLATSCCWSKWVHDECHCCLFEDEHETSCACSVCMGLWFCWQS